MCPLKIRRGDGSHHCLFPLKSRKTVTTPLGAKTPHLLSPGAMGVMDLERLCVSTQGSLDETWQCFQAQTSVILIDDPQVTRRSFAGVTRQRALKALLAKGHPRLSQSPVDWVSSQLLPENFSTLTFLSLPGPQSCLPVLC